MAAELVTPVDELTGVPLPLVPTMELPDDQPEIANWNHAWHPKLQPELLTVAGKALQCSRIQLVLATDHNVRDPERAKPHNYHDWFAGPKIPDDPYELFETVIYSVAGFIPERAIDLSGDSPKIVDLTPDQYRLLITPANVEKITQRDINGLKRRAKAAYPNMINPPLTEAEYVQNFIADAMAAREGRAGFNLHYLRYKYTPVRDYFRNFILKQNLEHLKESPDVDEFLLTRDMRTKARLARWLLTEASAVATDSIEGQYSTLKKLKRFHPATSQAAHRLVECKLGSPQLRAKFAIEHQEEIKSNLGLAA